MHVPTDTQLRQDESRLISLPMTALSSGRADTLDAAEARGGPRVRPAQAIAGRVQAALLAAQEAPLDDAPSTPRWPSRNEVQQSKQQRQSQGLWLQTASRVPRTGQSWRLEAWSQPVDRSREGESTRQWPTPKAHWEEAQWEGWDDGCWTRKSWHEWRGCEARNWNGWSQRKPRRPPRQARKGSNQITSSTSSSWSSMLFPPPQDHTAGKGDGRAPRSWRRCQRKAETSNGKGSGRGQHWQANIF